MADTPTQTAPPSYGWHARTMLVLGFPLIGSHLAQFAIQLTDTLMLGRYGIEELAALVLAGTVYFVLFIVGSGFAWAVMPMVASSASAGDDQQVRRVTRMGMWLSILFGFMVTPAMLFSESILLGIGQDPELSRLAGLYLSIVAIAFIPGLLIMVLKSYLAALERTQVVFWITLAMAVLNAVLNYALIFGNWGFPEMGLQGAAIASVTMQLAGFIALIVYVVRVTPTFALFQRLWRPDWEAFGQVFRLGWPIGLTNLAEVGLFGASSIMVGWIGTNELAAHGIALNIASATFMVHVGLSQAATIRVGQYFGRNEPRMIRASAITAYGLSALFAGLTIVAFLTLPELLIGAFIDLSDPAWPTILAIGTSLLVVAALFQFVDAAQVMSLGMLRGVQDTRVPMILAGISYWLVGAPAAYVIAFPLNGGAVGVWMGLVVGLAGAGIMLFWRFWSRYGNP